MSWDTQQHLTDAFVAAGYQVSASDLIGANTSDLAPFMQSSPTSAGWPAPGAQITVTALGANDVHVNPATGQPYTPVATAEANSRAYLDAVDAAGSLCDVLVELPETTPWGFDQTGPVWNAFLASVATERSAIVVPWASTVAEHPEYVGADGIHQTSAGKLAYLLSLLSAVTQCASNVGLTPTTTDTTTSTPSSTS